MRRTLLTLSLVALSPFAAHAEEWETLFNGKDLSGWKGKSDLWSVKDGAITGYTSDGKIPGGNSFLIWDGKVKDFELKLKFKILGGNSGIQYRSKTVGKPEDFVVGGYQADIDSAKRKNQFLGICYEERGRGFLCNRGMKSWVAENGDRFEVEVTKEADILKALKEDDWNEYHVTAKANHLLQQINGKTTAEVIDLQKSKRADEGLLAFQIHAGMGEMTVQYKDVQLKKLSGAEEVTLEKMPIPEGAKKFEAPKPKPKAEKK